MLRRFRHTVLDLSNTKFSRNVASMATPARSTNVRDNFAVVAGGLGQVTFRRVDENFRRRSPEDARGVTITRLMVAIECWTSVFIPQSLGRITRE